LTGEVFELVEKELFEGELSDEEMDKLYVQLYFIHVYFIYEMNNLINFQATSKKKIKKQGIQAYQ
jgi:hypothetical protein